MKRPSTKGAIKRMIPHPKDSASIVMFYLLYVHEAMETVEGWEEEVVNLLQLDAALNLLSTRNPARPFLVFKSYNTAHLHAHLGIQRNCHEYMWGDNFLNHHRVSRANGGL